MEKKARGSNRYSILSDPRLSQLFQLSSQLEMLAETMDLEQQSPPPPLPPKNSSSSSNGSKTPNGNQANGNLFEIEYRRLGSNDEEDNRPRYSVLSEDMSTSEESSKTFLDEKGATAAATIDYCCSSDCSPKEDSTPWQARCLELESSLHNFREQAQNIREMLREKLAELEQRVVEAETRAEDAEDKVRQMESRLVDSSEWSPTNPQPGHTPEVLEKDKLIQHLETEVEQQRQLRLADAKQVEAKAARIKDWVTNKLRELEEQNQHLKAQNAHCNEQMELLRKRLEQLQIMGASTNSRSSRSSRQSIEEQKTNGHSIVSKKSSTRDSGSLDLETPVSPVAAAVVAVEKSPLDEKPVPPPRAKLTPQLPRKNASAAAAATRPESACNVESNKDDASVAAERHRSLHMPLAPLEGKKLSKKAQILMSDELHDYSEIYTPSCEQQQLQQQLGGGGGAWGDAESMSSGTRTGSGDSGMTSNEGIGMQQQLQCNSQKQQQQQQPPPRPMHRYPSWEGRIYQLATEGLPDQQDAKNNNSNNGMMMHQSRSSLCYGNDVSVPVYATVKGRASQIRSVPFSGDSDDNSDEAFEEDEDNLQIRGISTSSDISLPSPRAAAAATGGRVSSSAVSPCFKFTNALTVHHPTNSTWTNNATAATNYGSKSTSSSGKLDASVCSDGSDYAIPPDAAAAAGDAQSTSEGGGSGNSLLHSSRFSCIDSPRKTAEKALEKSGYLTKLGGKIKSWKRRYFALKNNVLSYWKSQHDCHRKPQGIILLDESCRVSRANGSNTFEIATASKTYYLTADSPIVMEEWVRVLQNVVQRNALKLLLSREDQKATLQGWLTKVKHGHGKKCWCVLIGKMFIYFKSPNDQNPSGQINMRDSRVEEVEQISDSDSDDPSAAEKQLSEPTLGIFPNHVHDGPTYLIFGSKAEKEKWLYQLTVVSGANPKQGTQFEQLLQKLMEEDGNPSSAIWRHPLMVHSKEPITAPLTTFTKESLQAEAIKLFKSIQLFTSVVMDSAGIDYHVMLAANAFQQCLDVPELQPELLCGLVKQTSKLTTAAATAGTSANAHGVQQQSVTTKSKSAGKTGKKSFLSNASHLFSSDSSSQKSSTLSSAASANACGSSPHHSQSAGGMTQDAKSNPSNCVLMQAWMLMSMAVSIFVPKDSKLLWFLRTHFARNKDSITETGKYASYCSRALERAVANGPRHCRPSRMEVLSILLKNPHHHSLPHALPVHFLNETYHVVGYDGSTTIAEFTTQLNRDVGFRASDNSGFVIYSDDPIDKDLDHALHPDDKVCDVISRWETALREKGLGKFENKRVIRFTCKNRMYFRRNISGEADKERLLLAYQVNQQIVRGQFPLNKDLAFELCALMAQIHYGDLPATERASMASSASSGSNTQHHHTNEALDRFFPTRYLDALNSIDERRAFETCLVDKWTTLRGKGVQDCVRIFLTCTRKWQFFGAKLFEVQAVVGEVANSVWLSVSEDGICVLDYGSMQQLSRHQYDSIITFGGCQDDFMLVLISDEKVNLVDQRVSQESEGTTKLLFHTRKSEILAITLLIADYMNMIGRLTPGCLPPATAAVTPKLSSSTLSRGNSIRGSSRTTTVPNTPRLQRLNN